MTTGNEKNYTVLSTRCDETSFGYLYGISAEAVIDCQGEKKYLEASWIADTWDGIQFDIMNESIHDILIEDGDMKNIQSEKTYIDYEEALKTKYGDVFKMLTEMVSNRINENGDFDEIDEDDDLPDWYQPTEVQRPDEKRVLDSKEAIFRKRLALTTDIKIPNVNYDIEGGLKRAVKREIKKLEGLCEDEQEYKAWVKNYIESEYEKVKEMTWVTIPYLFAGIGQYSVTLPETEVEMFKCWIDANGSAFMGDPEPAEEEDIKNAIAMAAAQSLD